MQMMRFVGVALLLTAACIATATAQEAPVDARSTVEMTDEETARAEIKELFGREEVREAARIGGIDLAEAEGRLESLEGEQLRRAAHQARAIESALDSKGGAQIISIQVTTLIIILLLVIIIIILA